MLADYLLSTFSEIPFEPAPMKLRLALPSVLLLMFVSSVKAGVIYELSATGYTLGPTEFDPWSLTFDDLDNDMLFSLDELISFSGFAYEQGAIEEQFPNILSVPDIAGVSDGGASAWVFSSADGNSTYTAGTNAYQPEFEKQVVPSPATLTLFALGLLGIPVLRQLASKLKHENRLQALMC